MTNLSWTKALGLALAASAFALPGAANAAVRYFEFTVTGFNGGGSLTGTFSGEDANGDGSLVYIPGGGPNTQELTAFSATFSGNSAIPNQVYDLSSLSTTNGGFIYEFSGTFGGNVTFGEGFVLANDASSVRGGPATNALCDGTSICFEIDDRNAGVGTSDRGAVTEVAGPGAPAPLLGLGLLPALAGVGGIVATRRRRALS